MQTAPGSDDDPMPHQNTEAGLSRRLLQPGASWDALCAGFRWTIPQHFNIAECCCDSWAVADPKKLALIDLGDGSGEQRWSYGALKDASDRLANAFAAPGLKRGDRVGVLLPQGAAVLITHFAAMKLGAVALPLFTLFGPEALAYRLADSSARIVVTDGASLEKLDAIRADLPDLAAVFATDGARAPHRDFWAEIAAASPDMTAHNTLADDPAVLIYTSGTTGPPKGVLHAHRFLLGHLPNIELSHGHFPQPGDCGRTPVDWAWIGGLMDMAMPCLYYGVPLVARRMRRFDPGEAYRLIAAQGVRNLFLPPTALKLMRQEPVPPGLAIRSVASGGESLGAEILDWGRRALGAPINEIYGQTECNLVIAMSEGLTEPRPGAMGRPVPGVELALIDAAGNPVAPGEIGEIAVRRGTPVMFLGYLGKPEKTAAKFTGDWLRTGDLGRADAEGYITYVARDDDIIASAGYRIGPSEIENCLTGDPDVVMAACVGIPDPIRGEVVKAFVVLRDGASWDGAEARLIDRVCARISPHVAPRSIERRTSLADDRHRQDPAPRAARRLNPGPEKLTPTTHQASAPPADPIFRSKNIPAGGSGPRRPAPPSRQKPPRLFPRKGFQPRPMFGQPGLHPWRVMLREVAQPPGDGLLDEPLALIRQPRGPAQHPLARRQFGGLGVVLPSPGQGRHKGGAAGPERAPMGPALDLVKPRRQGHQPLLRRHHRMISNRPAVEVRHPGGDQRPDRSIVADPRLGSAVSPPRSALRGCLSATAHRPAPPAPAHQAPRASPAPARR